MNSSNKKIHHRLRCVFFSSRLFIHYKWQLVQDSFSWRVYRQVFCQVWHAGSNAKVGHLLVSCHFLGKFLYCSWFLALLLGGGILWTASRDYVLLPWLWILPLNFPDVKVSSSFVPGWLAIARAFTEPELMELQSLKDNRLLLPWNKSLHFPSFKNRCSPSFCRTLSVRMEVVQVDM